MSEITLAAGGGWEGKSHPSRSVRNLLLGNKLGMVGIWTKVDNVFLFSCNANILYR